MGYHLEHDEQVAHGIKRMATEQVDTAIKALTRSGTSRANGVHEARKSVKKVRALIRLARPELGSRIYRHEQDAYRAIGRTLSDVRDAVVLVETADALRSDVSTPGLKRIVKRASPAAGEAPAPCLQA